VANRRRIPSVRRIVYYSLPCDQCVSPRRISYSPPSGERMVQSNQPAQPARAGRVISLNHQCAHLEPNVLSTNSVLLPPLVPGQTYLLVCKIQDSVNVTNAFEWISPSRKSASSHRRTPSRPAHHLLCGLCVPVNADFATEYALICHRVGERVVLNQTNLPRSANPRTPRKHLVEDVKLIPTMPRRLIGWD